MNEKRGEAYGVKHLECVETSSLANFVSNFSSSERAKELIELGAVYVNHRRVQNPLHELAPKDYVRIHSSPRRYPPPSDLKSRIRKETDDYYIIDKPSGLPVHALVDNAHENLISYLQNLLKEKLYITHRLDIETSGLVVLARNSAAQAALNEGFAKKEINRSYFALVESEVPLGSHIHYMQPSPKAPKVLSDTELPKWQKCELILESCEEIQPQGAKIEASDGSAWVVRGSMPRKVFLVRIDLVTGRTHQIRAQLSKLGVPILGDQTYGSNFLLEEASISASAIGLRAWRIRFN